MKLRDRLVLFSTIQLVLFGGLFALAYWQFAARILPIMDQSLTDKTAGLALAIARDIDVALATEDPRLAAEAVDPYVHDPDVSYLALRTTDGRMLLERGEPAGHGFEGASRIAHRRADSLEAWVPVTLEGVKLGTVSIALSTSRVDAVGTWAARGAMIAGLVWLIALGYSIWFARSFVTPIHAMMKFSRKVATGAVSQRLPVTATDELGGLQADLNSMASELEQRERERQRQAAEALELQSALVTVSRIAGRAEVATTVLHNVGNVLNSLNVSVSVIADQLRDSKVSSLARTMATVGSAPGGLVGFLATEKGRLLPQYLASLTTRLTEENAAALAELASVGNNVDHIKTVIATQQSYAVGSDMTETVGLSALIDDALRMGEGSFSRHAIEVVKHVQDDVAIETDRHRLLEILINVITNARQALKERDESSRRLAITLRRTALGVAIEVADNGVGFPAENLNKLFQHGFTTKRGGHGFGLHACANATQELGGSIVAASAGAGLGAQFTIELPLKNMRRGES
ncbi:MAG: ATP-binding protein [Kofleriaceae bacterium]